MPVQNAQHRRSVRTSASKPSLHRNTLADEDFKPFLGKLRRGIICLRRLPGKVFLVLRIALGDERRGRVFPVGLVKHLAVAVDLPGRARSDVDGHVVVQRDCLHDGFDVVIAVLTLSQNVKRQVDLGKCTF